MEDRQVARVAPPDRRTAARRRAARRRSSARRARTRGPSSRSRSRTRRALSPIASPLCAAGTHWLTIMAVGRQRLDRCGRPDTARSLLELLRGVELVPEIERDLRLRRARLRQDLVDEPEQRAGEVLRLAADRRPPAALDDRVLQRARSDDDRVHQRARRASGSLSSNSTPAPSIVAGTAVAA